MQRLMLGLSMMALPVMAATYSVDSVKQRYPWNGLVDIDYTVTYAADETAPSATEAQLSLTLSDGTLTVSAHYFRAGALPMDAGTHHVVWDSAADGCKAVSDKMKATLSLVTMPEKYIVVDLSGGHIAQHFAVSYLDAPPAGGFNTIEYKTKKLVLKLVPAGTFIMGSPDDEPSRSADEQQHVVAITKPFYMALFELTRGQYETITGLSAKDRSGIGATRPFTLWSATNVRGEAAKPTNFKLVGTLSHKTGLSFEFPSEAQWEYACRAGTTTMRYSMADLSTIARYKDVTDADKAYPGWYGEVGTFPPNPWGFYDMYGSA